jgi:hypothetical protein
LRRGPSALGLATERKHFPTVTAVSVICRRVGFRPAGSFRIDHRIRDHGDAALMGTAPQAISVVFVVDDDESVRIAGLSDLLLRLAS